MGVLEIERSIVVRNGSPFGRVSSLETKRMWGRRGEEGKERARERQCLPDFIMLFTKP
jgi:hypothetical protein